MNYITDAFYYVISDPFFMPSLTAVTIMGLFVGATVFNGDVKLSHKYLFSFFIYSFVLSLVNLSRILPRIFDGRITVTSQPLAGTETNFFVTVAYLAGMYIGVLITKKAHKKLIRR